MLSHAAGREAEVKERPSLLPTRPSVCRNSSDLGGSEILMHFWWHIFLEALLYFCLHRDHPSLLLITHRKALKRTQAGTKHTVFFLPEQTSLRRSMTESTTKSPQNHYNDSTLESFKYNKQMMGAIVSSTDSVSLWPRLMTLSRMP